MPTALIIEDHEEISIILRSALEMLRYEVELAANGQAALNWLDQFVPDLIVLDLSLPQVSGHYVYKHIRVDPRLDQAVVIVYTANNILAAALANGLAPQDRILMKPAGAADLIELVKSLE